MKVSFVSTVLNEEETITLFLQSIASQTKIPDEVIIVDAGSADNTKKIISNFLLPNKKHIKLIVKKGNRSIGRNTGIHYATGEIIAVSDAGCILDERWLENIIRPFTKKNVDIVSGYYYPLAKNIFEKCLAAYTCVMPDRIDQKNFLPSSRSIAFRKRAWEQVGGYPEYLDYCEDLVFDKKLKQSNMKFIFNKNAFVFWPQRNSFAAAFKQFFHYAEGDGIARYIRKQTPLLYFRYLFLLVIFFFTIMTRQLLILYFLVFLSFAYFIWAINKNYRYVNNFHALYILPALQCLSDVAVLSGMTFGVIKGIRIKR